MKETLTRTVKLSFDGKILVSELLENAEVDVEHVMETFEASQKLTGGRPFVSLVIAAPYSTITKEARELSGKKEMYRNNLAQG